MACKVIVTGAAGFIGSHTVECLLAAGHSVWGVDNFRTGRWENLVEARRHQSFEIVEMDVADEPTFVDFTGGVRPDVIIHLAALVSVPESIANPELNDRLTFQTTKAVANAAKRHQVGRIVFASSAAVYGNPVTAPISETDFVNPLSPYGSAKLASEKLLLEDSRRFGFHYRCQRYFNVYGPRQDPSSPYSGVISVFLDKLRCDSAPVIYGDGGQTRDFISVRDVSRANLIAATKPGIISGVANICTGAATSINELWHLLNLGRSNVLDPSYLPPRPGDIRHSCGSPLAALREIGFQPEVALEDGLQEILSHLQPAGSGVC